MIGILFQSELHLADVSEQEHHLRGPESLLRGDRRRGAAAESCGN
jgi:hypothetical protein